MYDQLKERLFTGQLRAGQFVSQRELAELLGATLNPVREAIRKLEAEGLINVYAQRGIQIIEGGPKAINDAYDYRQLLEHNAIRNFARMADEKTIDAMLGKAASALRLLSKHPTNVAIRLKVLDQDYEFHKDLIDFKGNAIISKHYSPECRSPQAVQDQYRSAPTAPGLQPKNTRRSSRPAVPGILKRQLRTLRDIPRFHASTLSGFARCVRSAIHHKSCKASR